MAAKKNKAPARTVSDEELTSTVRDLVKTAPGLASSEFKKELRKDYQPHHARAVEIATELAARGEMYRWSSARKVRFFPHDPYADLSRAVQEALTSGPLEEAELQRRVIAQNRGYGDLLRPWLKAELTRGGLHRAPPVHGSNKKRISAEADLRSLLKKVIAELEKVMAKPPGSLLDKARLLEVLTEAFPDPLASKRSNANGGRDEFLRELDAMAAADGKNGLLLVRELRARLGLSKEQFDRLALGLSQEGAVTLHHHDYPTSLPEAERRELVVDARGTHYVGIAPRGDR